MSRYLKANLVWLAVLLFTNTGRADEIAIAVVGALTGPFAVYGRQAAMGVQEAVADINKVGLHGKRIVLITDDDGCVPAAAVRIANRLAVRDRVKFVVGHSCQAASLAASQVYTTQKVVQILIAPAGVNAIMPDRSDSLDARKVVETFKAHGEKPSGYTLYGYAVIQAWAEAARSASSDLEYAKVMEALIAKPAATIVGPLKFEQHGPDSSALGYFVLSGAGGKPECPACPKSGDCPSSLLAYAEKSKCECPKSGDCPQSLRR